MKLISSVATVLLLAATAVAAAVPAPVKIKDMSFRDANGNRVLKEMVVVDAPAAEVWKAFTTDEGFQSWAVPVAHITPGNGGMMESALSAAGKIGDPENVRTRILVYLPRRLLVLQNEHVPAGGPIDPVAFNSVRTMIEFQDMGPGHTKVTQTVIGFTDDPAHDGLYAHLRDGNAGYLAALAKNFRAPAKH